MNPLILLANTVRRLETLFPGYFPEAKHNHYRDFGWPENVTFRQFFDAYCRNSVARAAVDKTIAKTWQDFPFLLENEEEHDETSLEADIRQRFADLRLWQRFAEADRRALVGSYAAVILRFADSRRFNEPVETVPGGLDGLVEVIPAWEGQLAVAAWDTDETSETYGQPAMFSFNEAQVGGAHNKTRQFELHPDRVIVWSKDGTLHGRSFLEPGYNDLLTLEKISGAGGEGFWKNAKAAPVLEVDKEANLAQMAKAMGVPEDEIADVMDEQVDAFQKGFDKLLMLQGMEAKTLSVNLPSPEHFHGVALQSFCASVNMPTKILVGMQSGERASTEDAREWGQTNMSRRSDTVVPNIMEFVNRMERVGVLPENDWFLSWADLTEPTKAEKIERADKMAGVNFKMRDFQEVVFTPEEIRATVDMEPLRDAEKYLDPAFAEDSRRPGDAEDDAAALTMREANRAA